jgi:hypothetical protein
VVAQKLHEAGRDELADTLSECHTKQTIQRCTGCARAVRFWNRCDNLLCPLCQPRLAHERRKAIEWWTKETHQSKHVCLTVRNTEKITRGQINRLKEALNRLRRRKFARGWRGGFGCLEVTNESKGWHLHLHLLVDADWIDQRQLAQEWAKATSQDVAIVWVKDARGKDYQREVQKYIVKGTTLAKWTAEDLGAFVDALQGTRTFFTFGTLYKRNAAYMESVKEQRALRRTCECGCQKFDYFSPDEWEWHKIQTEPLQPNAPPPKNDTPRLAL